MSGRFYGIQGGHSVRRANWKFRAAAMSAALMAALAGGVVVQSGAAQAAATKVKASCAPTQPGVAHCLALRVVSGGALASGTAKSGPAGWHPADLQAAYNLDPSKGKGQTVAIVDAYDDPNAESDLAVYRKTFGLPPCTSASGCFRKVDQRGGQHLPAANGGWAEEISLDLDMVSGVCPQCNILLVEGDTGKALDLGYAVNSAVRLGATEVSNSYGYRGTPKGRQALSVFYDHPGVPITVSSGDDGYDNPPNEIPAAYETVTAVGGTSLFRSSDARGFRETAWRFAGSGCAYYGQKPRWQTDTGCAKRAVSDVAAVADPSTGVTVYDTFKADTGFEVFGGTSVSSPIIASVYALAGNGATIKDARRAYAHSSALFDVTEGLNGKCSVSYLCNAGPGYDGPTGLGTPNGTNAF
ncbi:MAG TPA: S8 family serine peptidase [Acidimicrobiia bacterium]|nr:S8 family serine peptidase [Acidimicrobiia bacterium]